MLLGISETANVRMFKTFAIVFSTLENLLVGISGALETNRKSLSKEKCVLTKCCRVSQRWWMLRAVKPLQLSSLHPRKLTGVGLLELNWNKSRPLSKPKHVLTKCTGVSEQQWMLELSNLCLCVQQPGKLTGRDFWSSKNERKPLSKLKHAFQENAVRVSQQHGEC